MIDELKEYLEKGIYPLHMPGHKRRVNGSVFPFDIDVTEVHGTDNLHSPKGFIADTMKKAEKIWKTEKSFILVNGSTCGIIAAVSAVTDYGDRILIARNCHKSVYHACEIRGLDTEYVYPETDEYTGIARSISPDDIEKALSAHPNIKAAVITSPTYEGVISDVKAIAAVCRRHDVILIVDEAHGAHLDIIPGFDGGAVKAGADIVIQSLHKTLPSPTQTAVAHIKSSRVNKEEFARQLNIFETSSPSYPLMCGIDFCLDYINEYTTGEKASDFAAAVKRLYSDLSGLEKLRVYNGENRFLKDPSRLVVTCENADETGFELETLLREKYSFQVEQSAEKYITAILTFCDDFDIYGDLVSALKEIDSNLKFSEKKRLVLPRPGKKVYSISDGVKKCRCNEIKPGQISGVYRWLYPPGIPVLVPGEIIEEENLIYLKNKVQ